MAAVEDTSPPAASQAQHCSLAAAVTQRMPTPQRGAKQKSKTYQSRSMGRCVGWAACAICMSWFSEGVQRKMTGSSAATIVPKTRLGKNKNHWSALDTHTHNQNPPLTIMLSVQGTLSSAYCQSQCAAFVSWTPFPGDKFLSNMQHPVGRENATE